MGYSNRSRGHAQGRRHKPKSERRERKNPGTRGGLDKGDPIVMHMLIGGEGERDTRWETSKTNLPRTTA